MVSTTMPANATGPSGAAKVRRPKARITPPVWLVYLGWFTVLFDPHYFVAAFAGAAFGRLATVVYFMLLILLLARIPLNVAAGRLWVLFPAYLVWLVVGVLALPVAPNIGLVVDCLKILLLYWGLSVATTDVIRTPSVVLPIVAMFGFRFLWWEMWGTAAGLVPWHPSMSNFDGYGTLTAQGAGICYWLAMGAKKRSHRMLLFALSAVSVLGVVASAARGAFLALVIVVGAIWLRSSKKLLTLGVIAGAAVLVSVGAMLFFDGAAFYDEIASSFSEGNSEGTGKQRWELWTAAFLVFKEHWLFGVGAGNVGAFAASFFAPGQFELFPVPAMFYGYNLHNSYMQVLAEFGAVGFGAFMWIHLDFFLKNRQLRSPAAVEQWRIGGGDRLFDLPQVSLALEAGFLALMLTNLVYANLFEAWLVVFWTLNRTLWGVTRSPAKRRSASRRSASKLVTPTGAVGRVRSVDTVAFPQHTDG
ncbi:MAG: O-antigen ligase family protein [Gemmatimonadaceae bacterium]|nr:O-antigen ligase family protein [Gemmatimonadaceae bacterium]